MNKYLKFFALGCISLLTPKSFATCLEDKGTNNCIPAIPYNWIHKDTQGNFYSFSGKQEILPSQVEPLFPVMFPASWLSENILRSYKIMPSDEFHGKAFWQPWAFYQNGRRKTHDYSRFDRDTCYFRKNEGTTKCDSDNAVPPEPNQGSGILFKREWECPVGSEGLNVIKNNSVISADVLGYVKTDIHTKSPFIRMCKITTYIPKKGCSAGVGNPCSVTNGNKFQRETDWNSSGLLNWNRYYNSLYSNTDKSDLGFGWTHHYNQKLNLYYDRMGENINLLDGFNHINNFDKNFIRGELVRHDGKSVDIVGRYTDNTIADSNGWFISRDESLKITRQQDGTWQVEQLKTGVKEYYNQRGQFIKLTYPNAQFIILSYENGLLDKVTDHYGRNLQFQYNSQGLISSIILPNNKQISYQYDSLSRLTHVSRPGYGTKTYHYSESSHVAPSGNPNLLTGITDEMGHRYANFAYDVEDRGTLTEHAGSSQKYILQHTDNYTLVTDPNGASWRYNKVIKSGTPRISTSLRANAQQTGYEYDQAGNITKKTTKGMVTSYEYDLSRNLETSRTEALGKAQERTINTTWHADFPKPLEMQEVAQGQTLRVTSYTYDNYGNALTQIIIDPNTQESRLWTYEYNTFGQMTKQTLPNGEESSYQYDLTNGNLLQSIDASGITTTYSQHNADGQPQHIETNNGLVTELIYDDAGRVIEQKQTVHTTQLSQQQSEDGLKWWQVIVNAVYELFGAEAPYSEPEQTFIIIAENQPVQQAISTFEYDPRGLLTATTLPDGERIEYGYDDAHRLTEIKDASGNRTVYTLNGAGDITQTEVYGQSGQLEAKTQQVYDNLGRLQQTLGNAQQIQTLAYNNYDQQTSDKNALNQSYSYTYDALGRQITEKNPLNRTSHYEYDALDQLKKVIDGKGSTTTYQYNAFGEVIDQNSPDTGMTNYQYQNGKLLEKVDANQRTHRYQYNAQGRVILQENQFVDGTDQYEQTHFIYGQTGLNQGKLTQANNQRAATQFDYNDIGLVRQKSIEYLTTLQSTAPQLKVYYGYTLGGKLKQIGLPSGHIVNYDYNSTGQLTGIKLNNQNFIDTIQYSANGLKGWRYSEVGDQVQIQYDLDGRIQNIVMPNVFEKQYNYDMADRILSINDLNNTAFSSSFKHDALSRLIEQNLSSKTYKYTYDHNSNRLSRQQITSSTLTENYVIHTGNNRINTIKQGTNTKTYSYLPTGQITYDGERSYIYNAQGRSETISKGASSIFNAYDAFGQRIQKIGSVGTNQSQTLFVYDESGQLLGEYTPQGEVIREYIWLDGILVGLRSYQYPDEILRVHTDHLGTPRAVSNNSNEVIWRWEGDQFGDVLPTGDLILPIRHAGQYYDAEVNLFYNYFRDYDPITGRYVQSDPIGLDGGLNTYGYVGGSPLHFIDPMGLKVVNAPKGTGEKGKTYYPTSPSAWNDPPSKSKPLPDGDGRYEWCGGNNNWVCSACTGWACSFAPTYCCKIDYQSCISKAIDKPALTARCNAQYAACTLRAGGR